MSPFHAMLCYAVDDYLLKVNEISHIYPDGTHAVKGNDCIYGMISVIVVALTCSSSSIFWWWCLCVCLRHGFHHN